MSLPPDLLPGFTKQDIETSEVRIRTAVGGRGPPLLLLHGHPQNHLTWHKIVPGLAERFTVVAPDLRGYGDSDKPASTPDHLPYSKRAMARDQVAVMRTLGHTRFAVVGHDRGGRVAHRMALDGPDAVTRLAVLDIAPTATMYARTDKEFATRYFWWFFLIQPYDLPERLISGDPDYVLRKHIDGQSRTPGAIEEAIFLGSRVIVMSARPGRIKAEIAIDLPHPRSYKIKTAPEFVGLKERLVEEIRAEALKVAVDA